MVTARAITIIEAAKMNELDPQAYLTDLLSRIADHKINRLNELMPWRYTSEVEDRQILALQIAFS